MPRDDTRVAFLLAVNSGGDVVAFASVDHPEGLDMLRDAARRNCDTDDVDIVRVEFSLPIVSAAAEVTVIERVPRAEP